MKRITYFIFCMLTCMALLTACGDDSTESSNNTPVEESDAVEAQADADADDDEEIDNNHDAEQADNEDDLSEVPVSDAVPSYDDDDADTDTDSDNTDDSDIDEEDDNDSGLTEAQENAAESPSEEFHASGTFNGFIDSSSVEVTMSDGSYQTFFVYDETVYNKLMRLSEDETPVSIQFTYKAREGQINPEIIAVN